MNSRRESWDHSTEDSVDSGKIRRERKKGLLQSGSSLVDGKSILLTVT